MPWDITCPFMTIVTEFVYSQKGHRGIFKPLSED